jgi:hypothetical protein
MSLGFKEFLSPLTSNNTESPKEEKEHTRNYNVMNQKNNSAHKNKRSHNHAFRYGYNYKSNKKI